MRNPAYLIVHASLIIAALLGGNTLMFEYSFVLYGCQLGLFFFQIRNVQNSFILISPSFITVLYAGLNFTVGQYLISRGFGINHDFLKLMKANDYISIITAFFLLCNYLIFLAIPQTYFKEEPPVIKNRQRKNHTPTLVVLFCLITVLNFFDVNLSVIGGQGNFNYPLQLALIIPFAFILASRKHWLRSAIYVVTAGLFTVFHFSSKREILYIIIAFIFCEVIAGNIKLDFSFKKVMLYFAMVAGVIYIILVSSILRGYGNYHVSGPVEAMTYVPRYVQEDYFINSFSSNIEANGVYAHASNSAKFVFSGKEELLWGSTLVKVLFLPIPRSVFPNKPKSMIDIYTTIYAPSFRDIGGSYPILLYSELLWNFYLFCLPLLFVFYRFFNKLCFKAFAEFRNKIYSFKSLSIFFLLVTLIQYVRGSGLELWLIYYIIAIPIFILVSKVLKEKSKRIFSSVAMPQKIVPKIKFQ